MWAAWPCPLVGITTLAVLPKRQPVARRCFFVHASAETVHHVCPRCLHWMLCMMHVASWFGGCCLRLVQRCLLALLG